VRENAPGRIGLQLSWRAYSQPDRDDTAFVHFLDSACAIVAQVERPVGGAYPPTLWAPGEGVDDAYDVVAGGSAVRLSVGLCDHSTGIRRARLDTSGDSFVLALPPRS
jgi:hypothetical protein